jgi:hypothetical protein
MFNFFTFIDAIIFLASSWIVQLPVFANFKILVMICSFIITDFLMIKLIWLVVSKTGVDTGAEHIKEAAKYIAMAAA